MWTHFMDMNSGGSEKEKFDHCYIELPEKKATLVFYNRFGHDPNRISCTCCGHDYSISEGESLKELTAYHRNVPIWCNDPEKRFKASFKSKYIEPDEAPPEGWVKDSLYGSDKYKTLEAYVKLKNVKVIYAADVKPHELQGEIPESGWVYVE